MSQAVMETEATIYGKFLNREGLQQASAVEKHLQVEGAYTRGDVRPRVRRTIKEGEPAKYVHTLKTKQKGGATLAANKEKNLDVDKEYMEMFTLGAEKYVVKTRYSYVYKNFKLKISIDGVVKEVEVPEIIFEVDVFEREDKEISDYCKIDIELDDINKVLVDMFPDAKVFEIIFSLRHLPINVSDPMLSKDPLKKAFIHELWEKEFNRRFIDG